MPQGDPKLLDATGRPVSTPAAAACPQCGSDKRVPSCGFGTPMAICANCGHNFQEVFRG